MRILVLALFLLMTPALASDNEALYAQAAAALEAGEHDTALDLAERLVRADRDDARFHMLLGNAELATIGSRGVLGQMRAAGRMRRAWERAVELDPALAEAHLALTMYYARAPGIAGGGRDKAEAQLALLEEIDRAQALRGRATLALMDDDPQQASAYLSEAIALIDDATDRSAVRTDRALVCQRFEDWDCAFQELGAALDEDPGNLMAGYQIGRTALLSEQNVEAGVAMFEWYLAQTPGPGDPSPAWAHTRLGQLLRLLERDDDAMAQYRAALALEPDHEAAQEALCELRC